MNKLDSCLRNYSRRETIKRRKVFVEIRYSIFCYDLDEKNIMKYYPLCIINCSTIQIAMKNGLKNIQTAGYDGACTVVKIVIMPQLFFTSQL